MRRRGVMAALVLAGQVQAEVKTKKLRFVLGQSWGPPFLLASDGGAQRGILPELMEAVAAELGAEAEWVQLPPMRVMRAMAEGEVDMHCLLAPAWWGEPVDPQRWSAPVLTLRDVMVAAPDGPESMAALQRRRGVAVGTVHGYLYPTLEVDFRNGRLRRDDAPNQRVVLDKLARSRHPVGVVNEITAQYFNRQRPVGERLRVLGVVDEVNTQCLLSARPGLPAPKLQAAIRKVVEGGTLRAILARYE